MTIRAELPSTQHRHRVFLVDDHPLVREWLANIINQQADLIVCGQTEGTESCIEDIRRKHPDIAILDIELRRCSGFDLLAEIKDQTPNVKTIVLTMHDSPIYARRALLAGAMGYVIKRESTRKICKVIRDVINGKTYVSEEAARPHGGEAGAEELDLSALSERELEIFAMIGLGTSTRQVADTLGLSIKTVQVHCSHIRGKLGIHGPTELLSAAVRWNERHDFGSR